jgi:hypothetical protein
MLWPEVEHEFRRLRSRPGVIAAGLATLGLGLGGGIVARRRARKPPRGLARLRRRR